MQAAISTPVPAVIPTITSLTFAENATKNGGKLVWTGTNIESVLFTGSASTYPAPFNYGAFTLSWDGTLVNMVAGVTYTMKIEARSSTGGSDSKTIAYTIAKPVEDNSAADASLKAAQEKAAAEKKAAEEAAVAALKIAQDKALAEAKAAADAAALKVTEEKAAAEAKAAADAAALKIAQEKAAAEAKAAADAAALKVAQEKAAAEAKAAEEAAALKVAEEKAAADAAALAIAKKTPVLNLFSAYSSAKYTASQTAKMKKLTLKLEPATTLKCVGYINTKGTTAAKAKSIALAQAKTACANAKKLNPSITTVVTTTAVTKAPKPLVGASNTKAKYRVDLFAYKG
jgi:colicin import membrane protein